MKILRLLRKLLSEFDPYGTEHGERVSEMAVRLAELNGITDTQLINDIRTAGLIHDVGKVGVPESVRRQISRYTPAERSAMQGHVLYGVELLECVINGTINKQVMEIVKYHHKDFGGTGYPEDAIKGNQIPYGARCLRICDSYDAMTHDRGYRHALTNKACLQELVDDQIKGVLFDPELFRIFLKWKSEK